MNKILLSLAMLFTLPCGAMQPLQLGAQFELPNIPGVITPQEFCRTTIKCSDGKLVADNKKLKILKDLWHKKTDLEIRTISVDDSVETMGLLLTDIEKIPNEKLVKALLIADKYCARKETLQTLACKIFHTQQNALEKNPDLELLVHLWGKEKINSIETLIKQNKIKRDPRPTINECESLFGIERLACKKEFGVTLRNCQFKKLSLADLIKFFPNLHFLAIESCVINNLDISALPVHSIFRCTESKVETISAKQNQPLYDCTIELDKSPLTKENLHELKTFLKPGWRKKKNTLTLDLRPNKLTQNNAEETIMYFDDPLTDLKVHADKKIKQIKISHINLKKLSLADLIKLFPNLNSLSISDNTIDNLDLSQMPDHFWLYTHKSQINTITAKPQGNAPIGCHINFCLDKSPLTKENLHELKTFLKPGWRKEEDTLTLDLSSNKLTQNNDEEIMYCDDPLTDLKVHADKKIKQIKISHTNLKKLSLADLIKLFPNLNSLTISDNTIDNLDLSQMPDHFWLYTHKSQINTITAKPQGNAPIRCNIRFHDAPLDTKKIEKLNNFFHRTTWQKLKQQPIDGYFIPFCVVPFLFLTSMFLMKSTTNMPIKEILYSHFVFGLGKEYCLGKQVVSVVQSALTYYGLYFSHYYHRRYAKIDQSKVEIHP